MHLRLNYEHLIHFYINIYFYTLYPHTYSHNFLFYFFSYVYLLMFLRNKGSHRQLLRFFILIKFFSNNPLILVNQLRVSSLGTSYQFSSLSLSLSFSSFLHTLSEADPNTHLFAFFYVIHGSFTPSKLHCSFSLLRDSKKCIISHFCLRLSSL